MNIIDKFLNEWKSSSLIRRSKLDKRRALSGRETISMAKTKEDPLYKSYEKKRKLYMEIKRKLAKKYKMKADREARQKIR